jgi:hypothetical protein
VNPFLNVNVQPSYGKNKAIINWKVRPGYERAAFYIFKSYNKGTPPWILCNEVPAKNGMYEDNDLYVSFDPYYRVLLVQGKEEYDSPIIGTFDKLSKAQYGALSKIMKLEHLRMSSGNGIQILHYIPLIAGEFNPNVDPLTQQQYGVPCPEDTENFGGKYVGNYGPPIYTWMEITKYGDDTREESSNGLDANIHMEHLARMLAFPKPEPGHLIIHPETDNRYAVASPVQGDFFRGVFPTSYNLKIQLLRKTDPRYRLEIPANLPTPLWAKYE